MVVDSKIGPNHKSIECYAEMIILCPDGNEEPLKDFNCRNDMVSCAL